MNEESSLSTTERPREPRGFDERFTGALMSYSQSTSRRGFLARCGKVLLTAVGVAIITEALPVDRRVADARSCTDWDLCVLYGRICDCCNGGSALNVCPSGSQWFNYWYGCCGGPFGNYRILYWDCCNCDSPSSCSSCLYCPNQPTAKPAWCNGGTYCCTAVVIDISC